MLTAFIVAVNAVFDPEPSLLPLFPRLGFLWASGVSKAVDSPDFVRKLTCSKGRTRWSQPAAVSSCGVLWLLLSCCMPGPSDF